MPALRFSVDGNCDFAIGAFRKQWNRVIFLKNKSKMTGDRCVFKFSRRSVDFMNFQSETSVFRFLRRSEVWALVIANTSRYVHARKARKTLTSSWIKVQISATRRNSDST